MTSGVSVPFIKNATAEQVTRYLDEICSDPGFLCSNKDLCATNTTIYTNIENVNKICSDISDAQKCDTQFDECLVNTLNTFDEDKKNISTSFINIIIPIPNAFDENANQMFLRLPALSGSKKPKSDDICNICACMNRFSTSPGASDNISSKSYTSPGQNTCIYPNFIEHFYYPLSIQNINTKLDKTPEVIIGKYKVFNKNIIFAHSEDDLSVINLYELLYKHGIKKGISVPFIINTLYQKDPVKRKELEMYLMRPPKPSLGPFYKNITFFYTITALLMSFLFLFQFV